MISWLSGRIKYRGEKFIILDVVGCGYKIYVSQKTLSNLKGKEKAELFTYLYVREDVLDLYGFLTFDELQFFEGILSVAGVGPKVAMNILAQASILEIKKAVARGDVLFFDSIPGIGRRKAERFILEFKDKIKIVPEKEEATDSDVVDALIKLGYSRREAQAALAEISSDITNVKEKIKEALKILAKIKGK